MPAFQITGLPPQPFEPLFALDDAALAARGIRRVVADTQPGYPCRISLCDAAPGDELLLLSFAHQPADSPYRASGPIFVRRGARQAVVTSDAPLPAYLTGRLLSLRAYDAADLMVEGMVCEGADAAVAIDALLQRPDVAYLHLHNANRGCFSCRVDRA